MSTSWKSQQGDGVYSLQFETDDKEKYEKIERAAKIIITGKLDIRGYQHGYWTGVLSRDYARAEGVSSTATEKEREEYAENFKHITHCSVCGGMFDDRKILGWKGCPYCLSKLDLDPPADENADPDTTKVTVKLCEFGKKNKNNTIINESAFSHSYAENELFNVYVVKNSAGELKGRIRDRNGEVIYERIFMGVHTPPKEAARITLSEYLNDKS